MKHRALAFLLAAAMVLTFMPVLAFAGDTPSAPNATVKPTKMTFTLGSEDNPVNGYIGSTEARIYQPDNTIVVTYSNGTKKTFRCVKNSNGYYRYYLNGTATKKNLLSGLDVTFPNDTPIKEGDNVGYLRYEYKDSSYVRTKINVAGVSDSRVKSVSYTQTHNISLLWEDLMDEPYDWMYTDKYYKGDTLTILKDEEGQDVSRTYTYQKNPSEYNDYYYCYLVYNEEWEEYEGVSVEPDFVPVIPTEKWLPGNSYEVEVYYHGVRAPETIVASVTSNYVVPNEVIFTPAEGYVPQYYIGVEDFGIEPFIGEGCEGSSFTVRFCNGTEKVYIAKKHPEEGYYDYGYFLDGDTSKAEFECETNAKGGLVKGSNDLVFEYYRYIKSIEGYACVEFPMTVEANQYDVYVNYKIYKYTGKEITPTFTVKNSAGKVLTPGTKATEEVPTTGDYYVEFTPQKKIGIYTAKIVFNDGLEERECYGDYKEAQYMIKPPKAPVLKSVKGGTKSLTVKWTKFTAAQRKVIDGFEIEIATDKTFTYGHKVYRVGKTAYSKTIKKLKKGKRYYVRISAYKNVKSEVTNKTYRVYSSNSSRKYAKTK